MSKKAKVKQVETVEEYQQTRQVLRMLVRAREDFQAMRKRMDNRMGRKADGSEQDITDGRAFDVDDAGMFVEVSDEARAQEKAVEKKLLAVLRRMPVYTEYLQHVKGVGAVAAAHICGSFDIYKAATVSKMWQYCGLNPGQVRGKKRVERKGGEGFDIVTTDTMIRGDKMTAGFVAPFNKALRTALLGVMADGFIKCQNDYAMLYYYPMKARLEQSANTVQEVSKAGAKPQDVVWSEAKKAHRHRAAMRYMVKMFLKDLYAAWRPMHGLDVRDPYAEEYLGKKHAAA
jgi:hypothetical protein